MPDAVLASTALIYVESNAVIFFLLTGRLEWKKIQQCLLAQVLAGVLFLQWLSFFYEQSQNYRQSVTLGPLDLSIVVKTLMVLTAMAPLWAAEAAEMIGFARALPAILNLTWFVGSCGPLAWLLISWKGSLVKGLPDCARDCSSASDRVGLVYRMVCEHLLRRIALNLNPGDSFATGSKHGRSL